MSVALSNQTAARRREGRQVTQLRRPRRPPYSRGKLRFAPTRWEGRKEGKAPPHPARGPHDGKTGMTASVATSRGRRHLHSRTKAKLIRTHPLGKEMRSWNKKQKGQRGRSGHTPQWPPLLGQFRSDVSNPQSCLSIPTNGLAQLINQLKKGARQSCYRVLCTQESFT